jgi:septal ring factor EnvC (AmiA/AmiB activator)
MKRKSFLNLFIVASLFLSLILAPVVVNAADKNKDKDEITLLKEKIAALEKKIDKQERQIASLGKKLAEMKYPYLAVPKDLDTNRIPKGSRPFKFQGKEYYMIPIDSNTNEKQTP